MLHKSNSEKMGVSQFSGLVLSNVFEYGYKSRCQKLDSLRYIFVGVSMGEM